MFLSIIKGGIPASNCDEVLKLMEKLNFSKTLFGEKINTDIRDSFDCLIEDEVLQQSLWQSVKDHIPVVYNYRKSIGFDKHKVYVLKYNKGQYFKPHTDGWSFDKNGNRSLMSIIIYINENYKGGETVFYKTSETLTHKPGQGDICIFDHKMTHEGRELISGVKYCVRFNALFEIMHTNEFHVNFMDKKQYDMIRYNYMERAIRVNVSTSFITKPGVKHQSFQIEHDLCDNCFNSVHIDDKYCGYCQGTVIRNEYVYKFRKKGMWVPKA